MAKIFEVLPHTADLKIRAYGKSLSELFSNMLKGMFSSIHPITDVCFYKDDLLMCKSFSISRGFELESSSVELLLVDFLCEALYLSDVYKEAYLDVAFTEFSENQESLVIKGDFKGVSIEGFEHSEIKAVTYHDLKVERRDDMWVAEVLFDI